jgi:hypothetical protein
LKKLPVFSLYASFVVVDLLTTFLGSPTLEHESSFEVSVLNLGWTGIMIKTVVEVLIIFSMDYYSSKMIAPLKIDSLSMMEGMKLGYNCLLRNSLKLRINLIVLGFLLVRVSIYFHAIASVNNLIYFVYLNNKNFPLYKFTEYYYLFDHFVLEKTKLLYDSILSIPISVIILLSFFRRYGYSIENLIET